MLEKSGVLRLWGAIWEEAMKEETETCKRFVESELREQEIKNIDEIIDEMEQEIKDEIGCLLLKEARKYPESPYIKYNYRKLANIAIERGTR